MQPTVTAAPLRQGRSSEKEITDLPNDLRDALNMTSRVVTHGTTAGTGVFTTMWTSDAMPEKAAWSVQVQILGRGAGVRCHIGATALYYREPAGVATQQGIFGTPVLSSGGVSAQFITIGNAVAIQVIDNGVTPMAWAVFSEIFEAK